MNYIWDEKDTIYSHITSKRTFIFLDYDGTLTPIVNNPSDAHLSSKTKQLLRTLSERKNTILSIVSGRTLDDLKNRVGINTIHYAGIHGRQSLFSSPPTEPSLLLKSIKQHVEALKTTYPDILLEDKHLSVSLHYRNVPPQATPSLLKEIEKIHSSFTKEHSLVVQNGKKVVEFFENSQWNKGSYITKFLASHNASIEHDAIIYIGDDTTDEDAFVHLPDALTISVGKKQSNARFWIDSVEEVTNFLTFVANTPNKYT